MELLIMAAGMGSRFGGLKQIEPIGPNGEFIIDYSIYDAVKAGFNKVVFIIKEENYEVFKETIGKRVEPYIDVEYVFQKLDDVPDFVNIPQNRVKPWGTVQAIYSAKDVITEPFAIINADDFYGKEAYEDAKSFLDNATANEYGIVGYKAENTLTENGAVKRGIIETDENGCLKDLIESSVYASGDDIICSPLGEDYEFRKEKGTLVSMNMLLLNPNIFPHLKRLLNNFFRENMNNLEKCEYLIIDALNSINQAGLADVLVIPTNATWYGITYKEDVSKVRESILQLIESGDYPNKLWEDRKKEEHVFK